MVTGQPDGRHAKARDPGSKMLIGRSALILCQITRRDNQIAIAIFDANGIKYSLITLPGVDPQQSFMLFGEQVSISNL
ncbi:hypothetical protein D3C76_1291210 [compost metagenome]